MKNSALKVVKNDNGKRLDDLSKDEIIGRPNDEFTNRVIFDFPKATADNERPKHLLNALNFLSVKFRNNNF